jgi:hypothetical protein
MRFSLGSPLRKDLIRILVTVNVALMHFVSQEKVMEMESELFIPNLQNPKIISLVSENIGRISNGSSSHCAGALKLGLKKAVELKKQNKGVQLRCPRAGCLWDTPSPYASVGGNVYCSYCSGGYNYYYYLSCVGCGTQRTSTYTSCQGCHKTFL